MDKINDHNKDVNLYFKNILFPRKQPIWGIFNNYFIIKTNYIPEMNFVVKTIIKSNYGSQLRNKYLKKAVIFGSLLALEEWYLWNQKNENNS